MPRIKRGVGQRMYISRTLGVKISKREVDLDLDLKPYTKACFITSANARKLYLYNFFSIIFP